MLLDLTGIPAQISDSDLVGLQNLFLKTYNALIDCGDGSLASQVVSDVEILVDAVDAFGDNGEEDNLLNFTYLVEVRGDCNSCRNGAILFNSTASTTPSRHDRALRSEP